MSLVINWITVSLSDSFEFVIHRVSVILSCLSIVCSVMGVCKSVVIACWHYWARLTGSVALVDHGLNDSASRIDKPVDKKKQKSPLKWIHVRRRVAVHHFCFFQINFPHFFRISIDSSNGRWKKKSFPKRTNAHRTMGIAPEFCSHCVEERRIKG